MFGNSDVYIKVFTFRDVLDTVAKVASIEATFSQEVMQVEYEDDIIENENFPTENYQMYLDFDVLSSARLRNVILLKFIIFIYN